MLNRLQLIGRQSTKDQDHDHGSIVARSQPDLGTIVARSWRKSQLFGSQIQAKLTPIRLVIEATIYAHGIAPLMPSNRLHDCVSRPRSSGQFPTLKACISRLCYSTFDRFVKELSKFRGRSLVHRDPPAFRLDWEAIGAGLITNFSLISSNFPNEFRTSARKNPRNFTSIHEN